MQFHHIRIGQMFRFVNEAKGVRLNCDYIKATADQAYPLTDRTQGARARDGDAVTVRPETVVQLAPK